MKQSVYSVASPERRTRSGVKPATRVGTQINLKIVWALCGVALSGAAVMALAVREPTREAVMLSPQSMASPQAASAPSMEQFPGLVSPPSLPSVPLVVAAPAAIFSQSPAQTAELSRARAESVAVTAGASSVPVSTWPAVVTRAPNEVPPRSDMRYQFNAPPPR